MTREERLRRSKQFKRQCCEFVCSIYRLFRLLICSGSTESVDFENSPEYKKAVKWWQDFKQIEGVEYQSVVDYAKELHSKYESSDKLLDDKADAIIKYLGGGTALVTFGALLSIKLDNKNTIFLGLVALTCLIPSLFCAILAVFAAVRVRRPQTLASLESIEFANRMAEFHKKKDKIEINLWLSLHPICEALMQRNEKKAKQVQKAHRLYSRSLALLSLPVIGIMATLITILFKN